LVNISRWLNRAEYFIKEEQIRVEVNPDIRAFILDHPDYIYSNYKFKVEFVSNEKLHRHDFRVYKGKSREDITDQYSA